MVNEINRLTVKLLQKAKFADSAFNRGAVIFFIIKIFFLRYKTKIILIYLNI